MPVGEVEPAGEELAPDPPALGALLMGVPGVTDVVVGAAECDGVVDAVGGVLDGVVEDWVGGEEWLPVAWLAGVLDSPQPAASEDPTVIMIRAPVILCINMPPRRKWVDAAASKLSVTPCETPVGGEGYLGNLVFRYTV